MVKVSVIVPVYNVEKFLKKCMDSIVNQTLEDIEIICINDGSTDSSPEILQSYAENDSRIMVINQENKGLGATRNVGLEHATGDYIYFIDSDDYIELNTLELAYDNIKSNDSDMVIFNFWFCQVNKSFFVDAFKLDKLFSNVNFNNFTVTYKDIKNYVLFGSYPPWNKLFKREFLNRYNDFIFPSNVAYEDMIFHVKTILLASKISILPEYLYYYKIDNSSSITNNPKNHMDIFKDVDMVEEFLSSNGFMDEFKNDFNSFKINQIMYHCVPFFNEEFYNKAKEELADVEILDETTVEHRHYRKYSLFCSKPSFWEFVESYYLQEIDLLDVKIDSLEKQRNNLNGEIFNLKRKNKSLNNEICNLKKERDAVLNSRSWRMTRLLRKIGNLYKKIISLI